MDIGAGAGATMAGMAGAATIAVEGGGAGACPTFGNGGGGEAQATPFAKGGGGAAIVSHKSNSQCLHF